jgi:membrane protease YdiL (CAAX protease family)
MLLMPFYNKSEQLVHAVIGTSVAFLTTFLFLKFDKKSFADIGLFMNRFTLKNFFLGMGTGIALMGFLVLAVIYFSDFKIAVNKNSNIYKFLWMSLPLIPLAFMEEVGFRGYPLYILKNRTGIRNSIIVTSVLFALYHIANGWTIQDSFLGAGTWGILYGLAATYSNGIAMSTGLHYAANLTTAAFGNRSDSYHIFELKLKEGLSLENYQSNQWVTLIPQISLLIFGIICMESYIRKKKHPAGWLKQTAP